MRKQCSSCPTVDIQQKNSGITQYTDPIPFNEPTPVIIQTLFLNFPDRGALSSWDWICWMRAVVRLKWCSSAFFVEVLALLYPSAMLEVRRSCFQVMEWTFWTGGLRWAGWIPYVVGMWGTLCRPGFWLAGQGSSTRRARRGCNPIVGPVRGSKISRVIWHWFTVEDYDERPSEAETAQPEVFCFTLCFNYTTDPAASTTVSGSSRGNVYEMIPIAGSSSKPEEQEYDYTEGASALDINQALDSHRVARRDSQYSLYNDNGDGSVFSGPGHTINPSSVSRMSHMQLGRRSSDNWMSRSRRRSIDSRRSQTRRRDSKDSQISRQSVERPDGYHDEPEETDSVVGDDGISSSSRVKRRPKSPPSPQQRISMFENIAHLFGRSLPADSSQSRRPSISQRSSTSRRSSRSDVASENALDTDEEDEERWGYSSGEEVSDNDSEHSITVDRDNASITASMAYDSEPPSPTEGSQTLPLLNIDPVFGGEARIEMDTGFTLLSPPPAGPPSRQTIYIVDEDSTVRFVGYEEISFRIWLWRVCSVLSFGILSLLGHWFPRIWLSWVSREKSFINSHNGFLVVEVCFLQLCLLLTRLISFFSHHIKPSVYFQFKLSYIHTIYPQDLRQIYQRSRGLSQTSLKHLLMITRAKVACSSAFVSLTIDIQDLPSIQEPVFSKWLGLSP